MSSDPNAPNPKILIAGMPGKVKSLLTNRSATRPSDPARRPTTIIYDPAGDYAQLADMLAGHPLPIPDQPVLIDPLTLWPHAAGRGNHAGEW